MTIHGHRLRVDACKHMISIMIGAIKGHTKAEILSERYCPFPSYHDAYELSQEIDKVQFYSKYKNSQEI